MRKALYWGVGFLLLACGAPKAASKSNFKEAINRHLEENSPFCTEIVWAGGASDFPIVVSDRDMSAEIVLSRLEAFAAVGLLEATDTNVTRQGLLLLDRNSEPIPARSFEPTPEGRKYLRGESSGGMLSKRAFCYAEAEVKEVTKFTEPSDLMGRRVSNVYYTVRATKIADWARREFIQAYVPSTNQAIESVKNPIESVAVMTLTSEGWEVSL